LPKAVYVWVGFADEDVLPSPKSHRYVVVPEPPAIELFVKLIVRGTWQDGVESAVNATVGEGATVM
jgi:hypothetical protein